MDDVTVEWSQDRYKECTDKLSNFLARQVGYAKADITFMPISAQSTIGIKDRVPNKLAPWYDGPSLLEFLDNLKSLERKVKAPFMMPINVSVFQHTFCHGQHSRSCFALLRLVLAGPH